MVRARVSTWAGRAIVSVVFLASLAACTAGEQSPSQGTYAVQFPSTAAAIATDFVQVLVFDVAAQDRAFICQNLVASRKRKDPLKPIVTGPQVNVCEMLKGTKPITVPYGEHAILAVALRQQDDFMTGCVLETFGNDNPLLSIPVALVGVDVGVPIQAQCKSVADRCENRCVAN